MDENSEYFARPQNLRPCRNCGRTFVSETLVRHEKVCKKTSSQRKVFDSSKQRSVSGVPGHTVPAIKKQRPTRQPQTRKSDWRAKHEEFIQTVRAARGVTQALRSGKELPPPPPPSKNLDYVQCPHCSRRFNEGAAERHIKFCADQHKRLETKNKVRGGAAVKAAEKQDRRLSYRPPLPSSGVRRGSDSHSGRPNFGHTAQNTQKVKQDRSAYGARDRHYDDKPFDTRFISNSTGTTKTGLKPRTSKKSTFSDMESDESDLYSNRRNKPTAPLHPSSGYVPSTNSRLRNGRNVPQFSPAHHNPPYQSSTYDTDRSNMSRKTSNLHERKSSRRNNGDADDILTAWDSHRLENGRRTFEREDSHYSDRRDDFHDVAARNGTKKVFSANSQGKKVAKSRFCHECGTRYPVDSAKFCCECGMQRMHI